jgi:hypothetical protein
MTFQIKLNQLRPHFLALLADHRGGQVLGILPDPYPPGGTVVVGALDLDLNLGPKLLVTTADNFASPEDWKAVNDAVSLFENAIQRAHTYVYSTARTIGLA